MKPFKPNYWIYFMLILASLVPTLNLGCKVWKFPDDGVMVTRYTLILSITISIFTSTLVTLFIDMANCRRENKKCDEKRKLFFFSLKHSIEVFLESFAVVCTGRFVSGFEDFQRFDFWFDDLYQEHLQDKDLVCVIKSAVDVVSNIDEIEERESYLVQENYLNGEQIDALKKIRLCCLKIIYDLEKITDEQENPQTKNVPRFVIDHESIKKDLKTAFSEIDFLKQYSDWKYGYSGNWIAEDQMYRSAYKRARENMT